MNNFSLTKILQDQRQNERFEEKKKIIKKDSETLLASAKEYNQKYEREIEEGTRKRALLLEEGKKRGLSENEIFQSNTRFLPTRQTPILNFLYFLMMDNPDVNNINVLRLKEDIEQNANVLTEEYNKKYGGDYHPDSKIDGVMPDVVEYIYGKVTLDEFNKIKKLKSLSKSDNKQEAFSAYTKCRELCEVHGLEMDKIPSY